MSNSVQDTLTSIKDDVAWFKYLKKKIPTNRFDGKIFQLENIILEIEYERNKNGFERT